MLLKGEADKKAYAAKLEWHLYADPGVTGHLEVTAFDNKDRTGDGKQIYSKKASGKFPHDDADIFFGMLEGEVEGLE